MAQLTFEKIFDKYADAGAAAICGILVIFGWLCLHFNSISLALLILSAAYVIGGYQSTKEGLTTLWQRSLLTKLGLSPWDN